MANKEVSFTFHINEATKNKLKAKAAKQGQSIKSILNKLVEGYLNDNK